MSRICLGVGHGGGDPGACNKTYNPVRRECDDNLRLCNEISSLLVAQGHTVLLTRTSDISMTVTQRRSMAIEWKADILVDIHRNSHTDATAKGIEIWIANQIYSPHSAAVMHELIKIEHQVNRGIKLGNSFGVLNYNSMPSMLIELGFISNLKDNELYDKYFKENAKAIAKGILHSLGHSYVEPDIAIKDQKETAVIQMCRSEWPKNETAMRKLLADIKAAGFEAFLVLPDAAKDDE